MSYMAPEAAVSKIAVSPSSGTFSIHNNPSSTIPNTPSRQHYPAALPTTQPPYGIYDIPPLDSTHASPPFSSSFSEDQSGYIDDFLAEDYSRIGYTTGSNYCPCPGDTGSSYTNETDGMVYYSHYHTIATSAAGYRLTSRDAYPIRGHQVCPTVEGSLQTDHCRQNCPDATCSLFGDPLETATMGRCQRRHDVLENGADLSPESSELQGSFGSDSGTVSPRDNRRPPEQTARQRHQANQRERKRMKSLNKAFESLRTKIPTFPYEKRLSKVDTLRMAIRYIQYLNDLVVGGDERNGSNGSLRSRGHNGSKSLSLRKVVINCPTGTRFEEDMLGFSPIRGLALSWARGDDFPVSNSANSTLSAKIWVPEAQQKKRKCDNDNDEDQ